MRFLSAGPLSLALALTLGWHAAQAQQPAGLEANLAPSDLVFRISGTQTGTFRIAADSDGDAVTYDLATSEVAFRLFDSAQSGFDKPLFCFDFAASPNPQLRLDVSSGSGHVALDSFALASGLEYRLTGSVIAFNPAGSVQCFYTGDGASPAFGLFGRQPPEPPEHLVFRDRFEDGARGALSIRFDGLPGSVAAGAVLTFRLIVENTGEVALSQVSFQEVFAGNAQVHGAALDAGVWTCAGFGGAVCNENTGSGSIRVEGLGLQPGQRLEYTINRTASGPAAAAIALYAGVVNGQGGTAVFDVDQASVVIGGN